MCVCECVSFVLSVFLFRFRVCAFVCVCARMCARCVSSSASRREKKGQVYLYGWRKGILVELRAAQLEVGARVTDGGLAHNLQGEEQRGFFLDLERGETERER